MKSKMVYLTSIFLLSTLIIYAQPKELRQGCDFLGNLHFKNGVDTIMLLAYKNATIYTPEHDSVLNRLHEEKKIDKNRVYAIDIQPVGCSQRFFPYCNDTSKFVNDMHRDSYNKPVIMKCVVFEGFAEQGHLLFIVNKVILKE